MDIQVSNRFVEFRKKTGLSQGATAEKLGVSRQAVSKWERGDAVPDVDNFVKLANLYNVSFDLLYYGVESVKNDSAERNETLENEKMSSEKETNEEAETITAEVTENSDVKCEETPEEITDNAEKTEKADSKSEKGAKIRKTVRTIRRTVLDDTARMVQIAADVPAAIMALSAIVLSTKSKKKMPYVLFAAGIVPAFHFLSGYVYKSSSKALDKALSKCNEISEEDAQSESDFEDNVKDIKVEIVK